MTTESINGPDETTTVEWVDAEGLIGVARTPGLVGESAALQAVSIAIARVAPHKGTVLIQGESGTGKEVVAEALHRLGPYPGGPLVRFNCSNFVDGLAESQLFGHVRGPSPMRARSTDGVFSAGQRRGMLLLDGEVGELPLRMQSKIASGGRGGESRSATGRFKRDLCTRSAAGGCDQSGFTRDDREA